MVLNNHPLPAPSAKDEKKRAVTIKDIAKVAGVHFTTVSLALRDHPSLPASTKTAIRSIADRMGYVPNPIFSALTHFHLNGRVRADPPRIAYLVNHSLEDDTALNRQDALILSGAREQARILGYELELVLVGDGQHDSRSLEQYLKARNINGVLLAGFDPGFARVSLNWDDYSVVKVHSMHMEPEAPVVGSDHRQDVRLAFQQLRTLGYQRIGLAVGRADEDATEHLYTAGFLLEQATLGGGERVPELLFPYNCSPANASAQLGRWVRRHRIEGVICNWPSIVELLEGAGLQVPRDVACASLCLAQQDGRTAGVCPNPQVVGAKAISVLTTLLKSGERGVPQFASRTYVRSYWQDGISAPAKD